MTEITSNGGAPPRVDPTKLTTDAVNQAKDDIRREADQFREVVFMKVDDLRTEIMSDIRRVNDVNDQKFDSVRTQFDLAERGRIEQKIDTKQAVDAALIAQKEAVKEQTTASEKSIEKSEAATTKQIDSQATSFTQGLLAVTNLLNDLKERVVIIEAGGVGRNAERQEQRNNRDERRADFSKNVSVAYFLAALLGVATTILGVILAVHG